MKPKLLLVVTQGSWGGAQRYVFDIATHSPDFGVTVAVGEPRKAHDLQRRLEKAGCTVVQLKHLVRSVHPLNDMRALRELKQLYQKIQPDVIHLNSSKAGVLGALAARGLKANIVYTVHGFAFLEPVSWLKRTAYLLAERWSAKTKTACIVLSQNEYHVAVNKKIMPKERLVVIPHGITQPSFATRQEARQHLQSKGIAFDDNEIVIGVVASLYPTKGLHFFIQALTLCAQHHRVRGVVIGAGPQRSALQKSIDQKKAGSYISIVEPQGDDAKFIKAFDIFSLSSVKEGLPYVLLEAMSAGLPIVATDVGGVKELLSAYQASTIVPPANSAALARALQETINVLPALKRRNNVLPERYHLQRMLDATHEVYRAKP